MVLMLLVRRLVIPLVVLAAVFVGVDRLSLHYAEQDVAKRLQAAAHTSTRPAVTVKGFPFLTQLFKGTFDDIDINMHGVDAGLIHVSRLSIQVHDAKVSIGDVISQTSSAIHVKRATAQMLLTYADIAHVLPAQVRSRAHLDHSTIKSASVKDGDTVLLGTDFGSFPLRLSGLPFSIRLTGAKATDAGVMVDGEAQGLLVPA